MTELKKELTIEKVLEKMKETDLKYTFKEKGKKHQYKKEGETPVSFIDRLDYIAMYTWNAETKKYDLIKLYTEKDFNDAVDIK